MSNAWNTTDLQVNYKYDLVMRRDPQDNAEIVKTGAASPAHTLGQSLYLVLQTALGEFALRSVFGASPKIFHGKAMTRVLISEIENYVVNAIRRSNVNADGFPVSVKAVPVTRTAIAMEIKVVHPQNAQTPLAVIRMMYNTTDNSVSPLYNGYGG